MCTKRLRVRSLFVLMLIIASATSAVADTTKRWLFDVYLDEREIGFHEFTVTERGGRQEVEITARFDVRILFFNAYSYDHENRETWEEDCLEEIEAVTDDNGASSKVGGRSADDGFVVSVNRDTSRFDATCLRSFAYWNPVILESDSLLNSQTGELVDVTIRPHGEVILDIGQQRVTAEKFTIEMEDGPIRLWYSPGEKRWLALEAETEGGRTLRYVPVALPWTEPFDTRLAMD